MAQRVPDPTADEPALHYLEAAKRRASEVDGLDGATPRDLTRVGVVGGGTMGQGIARACLAAGLRVILLERDSTALTDAQHKIKELLHSKVARGRLAAEDCATRLSALHGTTDMADLGDCDLVIEAVFEDMAVKKQVFASLEAALPPNAIIATNTSYLNIDEMAAPIADPSRVIGLHFFSPADVMALLEVVSTAHTAKDIVATGMKLARMLRKTPVLSKVSEGFIGNRIYNAYRRRAELLVLDGTSPQQVDAATKEFGFAMGPFLVSDMSGLDIAWAMRKRQAPSRDPNARYVTLADSLCEAGRLGRKTEAGWYDYADGKPRPSKLVETLITEARATAGIIPIDFDAKHIQNQLLAAILNEAALLLAEGVAQRPSDIDVALTSGYGFPRTVGGPLYWAAQQDFAAVQEQLDVLADAIGHGHQAGPVQQMIHRLKSEV